MKIAIFGGTGMLGFAVAKYLGLNGFCVDIISRKPRKYLNKQKWILYFSYRVFNKKSHLKINQAALIIDNLLLFFLFLSGLHWI